MFEKTRRNLTAFFSLILAVIVLSMTIVFYLVLFQVIRHNETGSLSQMITNLTRESKHAKEEEKREYSAEPGRENTGTHLPLEVDFLQPSQFIAVMNQNTKMIQYSTHEPVIKAAVKEWLEKRTYTDANSQDVCTLVKDGRSFIVRVFASDSIGSVAVGLEITEDLKLLHQMRNILIVISLVLLLAATAAGYVLAGKAMVPIARSYRRQQEFTADASHELRTPLSVMLSSVEVLEEHKQALPDFHQTVLANMKDEVSRTIRLTETLLTLARSDSGLIEIQPMPTDIKGLVKETLELMHPLAEGKGIALAFSDPSPDAAASASVDAERIRQLLIILVDNAIKYTPIGGEITLEVLIMDKGVNLIVRDNGIGISVEDQAQIFERFFRVDKARSRQEGGTGLGLSIAKWIAMIHKGSISVESELGAGSRFTVFLPR